MPVAWLELRVCQALYAHLPPQVVPAQLLDRQIPGETIQVDRRCTVRYPCTTPGFSPLFAVENERSECKSGACNTGGRG